MYANLMHSDDVKAQQCVAYMQVTILPRVKDVFLDKHILLIPEQQACLIFFFS